jgi:hypothetical protein
VKGGAGNDKKDSAGNNKGDDKKHAGGSPSQTPAVVTHAAPKAGQKTVVTKTKPALAGKTTGATAAAAPPTQTQAAVGTITAQRWGKLRAEAKGMLSWIAVHYAKNRTGNTDRTVDSGIATKMAERKAIKKYLKNFYENQDVPGSKDLKFYIVAPPRGGDKLNITGHRHYEGKDKSLGGKNLFNYHVNWRS